jgi:hypothetical protein
MNTETSLSHKDLGYLLGIADMPAAEQDALLAGIGELIMESVMIRAVSSMSDEEASALAKDAAACTDARALAELLHARVPDIDDLILEESQAFREECINLLTKTGLAS